MFLILDSIMSKLRIVLNVIKEICDPFYICNDELQLFINYKVIILNMIILLCADIFK